MVLEEAEEEEGEEAAKAEQAEVAEEDAVVGGWDYLHEVAHDARERAEGTRARPHAAAADHQVRERADELRVVRHVLEHLGHAAVLPRPARRLRSDPGPEHGECGRSAATSGVLSGWSPQIGIRAAAGAAARAASSSGASAR